MKTVLITGTSSGIGRELVTACLNEGMRVIATLRSAAERRLLFKEDLAKHGDRLIIEDLDVAQPESRQAFIKRLRAQGVKLDVLVNNAGYGLFGALEDLSETQIRTQMETNFFGTIFLTRELLPELRASHGQIITVSSVFGFAGFPLTSLYCASKFALEGWAEALAFELSPHHVRVNLVQPGGHRTGFAHSAAWGERSFNAGSVYQLQSDNYIQLRDRMATRPNFQAASGPSLVIMDLIRTRSKKLRVRVGTDAQGTWYMKRLLPSRLSAWMMNRVFTRMFTKPRSSSIGPAVPGAGS